MEGRAWGRRLGRLGGGEPWSGAGPRRRTLAGQLGAGRACAAWGKRRARRGLWERQGCPARASAEEGLAATAWRRRLGQEGPVAVEESAEAAWAV